MFWRKKKGEVSLFNQEYDLSCFLCNKICYLTSVAHRNKIGKVAGILFLCRECHQQIKDKKLKIEVLE